MNIQPGLKSSAPLTRDEAEGLTNNINDRLGALADDTEAVVRLIVQARESNAHKALGYTGWDAYVRDRFQPALSRLDKADRRPVVELMSQDGMSVRAIGEVVGVSHQTVANDLRASTGPRSSDAGVNTLTPPSGAPSGQQVTVGRDGKRYTRRERATPATPAKSPRYPLPKSYREAARKLEKAAKAVARWRDDDRYPRHRADLAGVDRDIAQWVRPLLCAVEEMSDDTVCLTCGAHTTADASGVRCGGCRTSQREPAPVYRGPDPGPLPARCPTEWSRRVQDVSAECPTDALTDGELEEIQGAAAYLYDYMGATLARRNL